MTRLIRLPLLGLPAVAALLVVACGSIASAHDGHEHENPKAAHLAKNQRTWTDESGSFHVHGSFVSTREGQVQIRKEDGSLLDLKLDALSRTDRDWVSERVAEIRRLNSKEEVLLAQRPAVEAKGKPRIAEPSILATFEPFGDKIKFRWDDDFFYVESNGIPDHRMMVGITAWQQQVPLPQNYFGENAWRIPLKPVPAKEPMSAKDHFFRGAIALAANGVPIFNPIKNDGKTDTLLAGELDEFGGHCGRADDYHYHVAPVHLEPKVGKGKPLAFALDGYPIYGYDEPDGAKPAKLDPFNGHEDDQKHYHYHATKTYPYLNGGFHGEVTEREGQVDPQPRAEPLREALPPLPGAKITDFKSPKPDSYSLTYEIRGRKNFVNYSYTETGPVKFEFVDSDGKTTARSYERGPRDQPRPRPFSDLSGKSLYFALAVLLLGGFSIFYLLRRTRLASPPSNSNRDTIQ